MDWSIELNNRRCDLIDKKLDGGLTVLEEIELESLQKQMLEFRNRVAPLPVLDLKAIVENIRDETISKCYDLVTEYFKGDEIKTTTWFKVKNPMLGEVSPLEMIYYGREERLLRYIENRKEEEGW